MLGSRNGSFLKYFFLKHSFNLAFTSLLLEEPSKPLSDLILLKVFFRYTTETSVYQYM